MLYLRDDNGPYYSRSTVIIDGGDTPEGDVVRLLSLKVKDDYALPSVAAISPRWLAQPQDPIPLARWWGDVWDVGQYITEGAERDALISAARACGLTTEVV